MDTTCNMFGSAKVMRHGNGHGQWSRKTISQWLHALGYTAKHGGLVERQLAQREAMSDLKGAVADP